VKAAPSNGQSPVSSEKGDHAETLSQGQIAALVDELSEVA